MTFRSILAGAAVLVLVCTAPACVRMAREGTYEAIGRTAAASSQAQRRAPGAGSTRPGAVPAPTVPPPAGTRGVSTLRDVPSLGTLAFPNSGAPAAQAAFLRGVAWLHSFGYEDAIEQFVAAQKADPAFALAYWGESLSYSQPLWFGEDVAKGRAALQKLGPTSAARRAKAKTAREQGYLDAVEALWGPGDLSARAQAYSDAMAKLAAANPKDDEAQLFYALSLLAILPRGDASLPMRQKAGSIAEAVFARNPKHPGAAHYILHAYDHGALAPKALPAARGYAAIAPASSHALHMPAHAFIQLGAWHDAAASDRASWDASVQWAARRKLPATMRDFHSLTWLHYEWTQLGRFKDAAWALGQVDETLRTMKPGEAVGGHHYTDSAIGRGIGAEGLRLDRGSMHARYVIESLRWDEMKGQAGFDGIDELFAVGFSAAKLGDRGRVEAVINEFVKAAGPGQAPELREQAQVMLLQMQALHLFAQGRRPEAFSVMDRATALQAAMPKPIGRPYPVKGADELYGELLMEAGRPADAVAWFERTLRRTPNRSRALIGLARAKARSGDGAGSRAAYEQLLENWRTADPELPELREVRAALTKR